MTEAEWLSSDDPVAMLQHLTSPVRTPDPRGSHVRGCWLLDLLLGKE